MKYINAFHDKNKDQILVVGRNDNGTREFREITPEYSFYYTDQFGDYKSIYGETCDKFQTSSAKLFRRELNKLKNTCTIFESDIPPIYKMLETEYKGTGEPNLNICFFDIEVDFSKKRGFAPPEDPFNEITCVSLYNNWENVCHTLVVAPKGMSQQYADQICSKFENTYLCQNEEELLRLFLELMQDADILTGWNSEAYDIPYMVGRIIRVLGRDYAKLLCHWNIAPKSRTFVRFKKDHITYDLIGRIHLDYLQLYKKYTYHEMHSYSLDAVGEEEVKERKVAYEGSLDKLYNEEFEKFVEYSRQDVMLMVKIDQKLQFINMTNTIAHDNCVLLNDTMGTVKLSDTAIILESHERGFVVPNKDFSDDDYDDYDTALMIGESEDNAKGMTDTEIAELLKKTIAGAYVADPKKGITPYIGSVDITSLYPSVIMALNISPETIYGQVDQTETRAYLIDCLRKGMSFAEAWNNKFHTVEMARYFERTNDKTLVHFEHAKKTVKTLNATGREIRNLMADSKNKLCISANGTIFSYEKPGIIPELLAKWFKDRKDMQAAKAEYSNLLEVGGLTEEEETEYKTQKNFWDQRQLIKKIQLNSLYGAITNPHSRFFDQRMGQSITLTGRCISRHMAAKINEILTGSYDYLGKCVVYGDTDSVYFSAYPIKDILLKSGFSFSDLDAVVSMYDGVADETNATFKDFMMDTFCSEEERSTKIKAAREIVATAGLFVKKKRYAAALYDKEGYKQNGKLKIMGMETQRSDTPKFIQSFLKELLKKVLNNEGEEAVVDFIRIFRKQLREMKPWLLGTPKTCNGLTYYSNLEDKIQNSRLPGHIRAAYNWNRIKIAMGDSSSLAIPDGGKVTVCKLKRNHLGITSIAYPNDQVVLPDWFKELPFDVDDMENILIDKKVGNLIGILNYNIEASKQATAVTELFSFE